jgi:sulfide:quinone oxidoreductase
MRIEETMFEGTATQSQSVPRVVIAGGGIAALEAVLALRAVAGRRVSIEVWATERDFVYGPLSVATPFLAGEVRRFPLDRLVEQAGGVLRQGRVISVDPGRHVVVTDVGDVPYDVLLLALGARSTAAVEGALTFRGPEDDGALADLLFTVVTGTARRLAFVLPTGPTRHLPLYELALETRSYVTDHGTRDIEITIITPESSPFAAFGPDAGDEIRRLLSEREIELRTSTEVKTFAGDEVHLEGRSPIPADRVVAMARLEGPRVTGIPCDIEGFVSVDEHGRVAGAYDVYAAGDMTTFPVKQGGIATQQADAAAEAIAARLGIPIEPTPFHAVLRSQLLTGSFPRYLHLDTSGGRHTLSTVAPWWPAAKIVGRYLTPFLAHHLGPAGTDPPDGAAGHETEVERQPDGTWLPI